MRQIPFIQYDNITNRNKCEKLEGGYFAQFFVKANVEDQQISNCSDDNDQQRVNGKYSRKYVNSIICHCLCDKFQIYIFLNCALK